jgi:cytosine/adenosine deaminase-related metal-dependent hydrolase
MADNATWVLCPESNRYISRLTPPIAMLRNMGANIAIGTDSLASARSLSMIENLRMFDNIPLNELLCYATINGAKALGIDDIKGSITQGKRPGLVVIEGVDMRNISLTEESIAHRVL